MVMPSGVRTPGYASIVATPRVWEYRTVPSPAGAPVSAELHRHWSLLGSFRNGSTRPVASASLRLMPSFSAPRPSGPSTRAAGSRSTAAVGAGAGAVVDGGADVAGAGV